MFVTFRRRWMLRVFLTRRNNSVLPVPSRTLVDMPFSPKRAGGVAYSLVMFVIVSVLAGVLIAGLFVPIAGVAGVSSKAAAAELDSIPAELATPAPATRSKVLMGNGKTLAYFYDENRIPVKLDEIAPVMRQAQLSIEDHRFYEHGALDIKGTVRALIRNSTGDGGVQGGSSITLAQEIWKISSKPARPLSVIVTARLSLRRVTQPISRQRA